ncbi:MAG: RidA family protein [Spirochaetaceae bacterium]|nr:RidA family protein [Spirochaetaceae bacterium]
MVKTYRVLICFITNKRKFIMKISEKLKEMGIMLPSKKPGGVYKPVVQVGRELYVSGQGCAVGGKPAFQGKVGAECTLEDGKTAARICAINALGALADYLGDIDKVDCIVKTLAFVNSTPDFSQQHLVANGCSEFLRDLFGEEKGVGARSAIGVAQLPGNIPVEIEFVFEAKV